LPAQTVRHAERLEWLGHGSDQHIGVVHLGGGPDRLKIDQTADSVRQLTQPPAYKCRPRQPTISALGRPSAASRERGTRPWVADLE
jgi:hypothetical protein